MIELQSLLALTWTLFLHCKESSSSNMNDGEVYYWQMFLRAGNVLQPPEVLFILSPPIETSTSKKASKRLQGKYRK